MDYKSSDKDAFAIEGDENSILLVRLQRPPQTATLQKECETLKLLGQQKKGKQYLPVAEIKECGRIIVDDKQFPAMKMKKYKGSSKSLIRIDKKDTKRSEFCDEALEAIFLTKEHCENGIESLELIEDILLQKKIGIDDIQFLIDDDGRFVINDAASIKKGNEANSTREKNSLVIKDLIQLLEEFRDSFPDESSEDSDEEKKISSPGKKKKEKK